MDHLFRSTDAHIVLVMGATAIAFLSLRLVFRVLNGGLGLILALVTIALILQFGFDISPHELWFEVSHLPRDLLRLAQRWS
jgi:hypothetical protein